METGFEYEYEYDYIIHEERNEKETVEEPDEEFESAVNTLLSLEQVSKEEEPATKKARIEEPVCMSDREIVHKMMGCRHCRSRFGHEEDITIHRRIDEIFNKMKQTVK